MNFEELSVELCKFGFLCSRKRSGIETIISIAGEGGVLLYLFTEEQKVLVGDIAKQLRLTAARTTNIINILEKKGYIIKNNDEKDKRKIYISLSESGKTLIEGRHQEAVNKYRIILERLGKEDANEYFRILGRIHEITEAMAEEGLL